MVRRTARHAALSLAIACTSATAVPVRLDFEGIVPHNTVYNNKFQVREYYNGGTAQLGIDSYGAPGPNLGVSFTSSAMLLCLNTLDVDCSATSKGGGGAADSGLTALFYEREAPYINVALGFVNAISLWYSQPEAPLLPRDTDVGIEIFDGLNGSGNPLASVLKLPHTPNRGPGCEQYGTRDYEASYCPFVSFSLPFAGVARSVHFTGNVNRAAFDDIVLDVLLPTAPGSSVPEPGSAATGLLALAALGWMRRRQPAADKARSSWSM